MRILLYCFLLSSTVTTFGMQPKDLEKELFQAAHNNDATKINELIVQNKVNIDVRNECGETALFIAATHGANDALQELLRHKPDINLPNNIYGWNPLSRAVAGGWLATVGLLLNARAAVDQEDSDGYTPLMIAYRKPAIAKLLIEKGADVNHLARDGMTTLLWAAIENELEVIRLLVNAGALDDVRIKTRVSKTTRYNALEIAKFNTTSAKSSKAQECADLLKHAFTKLL